MPAVKFPTDKLITCLCGFKPDHYDVWYGRTPYDIVCRNCMKQLAMAKCLVTGTPDNAIDYWNRRVAGMTVEEIEADKAAFREFKEDLYRQGEPRGIVVYWYKDIGEKIYNR